MSRMPLITSDVLKDSNELLRCVANAHVHQPLFPSWLIRSCAVRHRDTKQSLMPLKNVYWRTILNNVGACNVCSFVREWDERVWNCFPTDHIFLLILVKSKWNNNIIQEICFFSGDVNLPIKEKGITMKTGCVVQVRTTPGNRKKILAKIFAWIWQFAYLII